MLHRFLLLATSLISWKTSRGLLLFPENTIIQFTIGVSVPVAVNRKGGVVFSSGFQLNYALPWNTSQLESTAVSFRGARDLTLQDLYTSFEDALDAHGWQSGRECLLRTICELAATPLDRSDLDVVGEMIRLLFSPSEDLQKCKYPNYHSVNDLYHEAERLGKSGVDCEQLYTNCPNSLLDLFTKVIF